MTQLEISTPMGPISSNKSDAKKNLNKFSKHNNFIKLKSNNTVDDQVVTTF